MYLFQFLICEHKIHSPNHYVLKQEKKQVRNYDLSRLGRKHCWGRCVTKRSFLIKKAAARGNWKRKKRKFYVMFRIKVTSHMHRLGLYAYWQPFPPPATALGTCLWWAGVQGLRWATLRAAAWHPARLHRNQVQQQPPGSPGKARQGHS